MTMLPLQVFVLDIAAQCMTDSADVLVAVAVQDAIVAYRMKPKEIERYASAARYCLPDGLDEAAALRFLEEFACSQPVEKNETAKGLLCHLILDSVVWTHIQKGGIKLCTVRSAKDGSPAITTVPSTCTPGANENIRSTAQ
jgi:hypothetical protein